MEIIKNKRQSRCWICGKQILVTGKYKVKKNIGTKVWNYHLSCYFSRLEQQLQKMKTDRKKLIRYKNHMTIEKLQEGN